LNADINGALGILLKGKHKVDVNQLVSSGCLTQPSRIYETYPAIHIFIEREDKFYSEVGRHETLEQAKVIDFAIKETMVQNNIDFVSMSCLAQDEIINYILSQ